VLVLFELATLRWRLPGDDRHPATG